MLPCAIPTRADLRLTDNKPKSKRGTELGFALGASILLALSYPPVSSDLTIGLALVPLLWVSLKWEPRRAARFGAVVGGLGLAPSMFWVVTAVGGRGIAVLAITIVSFAFACAITSTLCSKKASRLLWVAPVVFVTLEIARSHILTPYLSFHSIGSALLSIDRGIGAVSVLPVVGVHGLSFILVFSAAVSIFLFGVARDRLERFGAVLIPLGTAGLLILQAPPADFQLEASFAFLSVQTSRRTLTVASGFVDNATDLLVTPQVVVCPQGVSTGDPAEDSNLLIPLHRILGVFSNPVIVGFEEDSGLENPHNAAAMWVPEGREVMRVAQNRPSWRTEITPGRELGVFVIDGVSVGFVLNTDINHSSLVRESVEIGSQVVLVLGQEEAWGPVGDALQLRTLKIRALETGRDIARLTRLGPSSIARATGDDFVILKRGEQGFVASTLLPSNQQTVYVRGGWIAQYLVLGVCICLLLAQIVLLVIRRRLKGAPSSEAAPEKGLGQPV